MRMYQSCCTRGKNVVFMLRTDLFGGRINGREQSGGTKHDKSNHFETLRLFQNP